MQAFFFFFLHAFHKVFLTSFVKDSLFQYFSVQVLLSDMTFHNMVPTAPPWEGDDDEIP